MSLKPIITIDSGNTKVSIARHENSSLSFLEPNTPLEGELGIISEVAKTTLDVPAHFIKVKDLKKTGSFLDLKTDFAPTIGDDRIACVYKA